MGDFWIVSNHKYSEHATLDQAEAERDRLAGKHRDQKFRVYRCKTSVKPSNGFDTLAKLLREAGDVIALLRKGDEINERIDAALKSVNYAP